MTIKELKEELSKFPDDYKVSMMSGDIYYSEYTIKLEANDVLEKLYVKKDVLIRED